jgi:hypothetical protein
MVFFSLLWAPVDGIVRRAGDRGSQGTSRPRRAHRSSTAACSGWRGAVALASRIPAQNASFSQLHGPNLGVGSCQSKAPFLA